MEQEKTTEYLPSHRTTYFPSTDGEVWQTEDPSVQSGNTRASAAEVKSKKLQPLTKLTTQHEEGDNRVSGITSKPAVPLPPINRSPRLTVGSIKPNSIRSPSPLPKPLIQARSITKPLPPTPSFTKGSKYRPLPLTPSTTKPLTKSSKTRRGLIHSSDSEDEKSTTVYVTGAARVVPEAVVQEEAAAAPEEAAPAPDEAVLHGDRLYSLIDYANLLEPAEDLDNEAVAAAHKINLIYSDPYLRSANPSKADQPSDPTAAAAEDYQDPTTVHDDEVERDYQNMEGLYEKPAEPRKSIIGEWRSAEGDIYENPVDYYQILELQSSAKHRMVERQNSTTPLVDRQISENAETDFHDPATKTKPSSNGDVTNGAIPKAHPDTNGVHMNGDSGNGLKNGLVRKNSKVTPINDKELEMGLEKIEECGKLKTERRTPCCVTATRVITALLVGIWFGWMLQKSSVFKPMIIRNQFLLKEFVMLKTFIGALITSQICLLIMSYIPQTKPHIEAARKTYNKSFTHKGVISTIIGAFILGAGMAVGGACPGMVLAQIGALVPNSAYTILGGIAGCLVYGLVHKCLIKCTTPNPPYKTQFIYEKLKVPYAALAIPAMIFCIAGVALMEIFITETNNTGPHNTPQQPQTTLATASLPSLQVAVVSTNTLPPTTTTGIMTSPTLSPTADEESQTTVYEPVCGDNTNWFTQEMWTPSVCGALIGLSQIPLVLILSDTMGSSSAYQTIASQWVVTKKLKHTFPYMANHRNGINNCWMIFYVLGAGGGAALASASSCSFLETPGVPWWQAITGGFLMLFGSRMASGCTSGHGISGAALLVGLSWLAVPAMFGGGIAVTFFMKYTNMNLFVSQWEPAMT